MQDLINKMRQNIRKRPWLPMLSLLLILSLLFIGFNHSIRLKIQNLMVDQYEKALIWVDRIDRASQSFWRDLHASDSKVDWPQDMLKAQSDVTVLQMQNQALMAMLGVRSLPVTKVNILRVMKQNINPFQSRLQAITAVSPHSVNLHDLAFYQSYVIGQVVETEGKAISIMKWDDPRSKIPAYIPESHVSGLIISDGQGKIQFVPHQSGDMDRIKPGQVVQTSAMGGLIQSGYPLGLVSDVSKLKIKISNPSLDVEAAYIALISHADEVNP